MSTWKFHQPPTHLILSTWFYCTTPKWLISLDFFSEPFDQKKTADIFLLGTLKAMLTIFCPILNTYLVRTYLTMVDNSNCCNSIGLNCSAIFFATTYLNIFGKELSDDILVETPNLPCYFFSFRYECRL